MARMVKNISLTNTHYRGLSETWLVEVTYVGESGARDRYQGTMQECNTYIQRTLVKSGQPYATGPQTVDEAITAITEAPSDNEALDILKAIPGKLLKQVADQLYVEYYGHSIATVRKACVAEARA